MIETSNGYARGLLAGVKDYIRLHGPWNVHLAEHSRGDRPPKWIADWDGDGVLARAENTRIVRALEKLRAPVVDVSSHIHLPTVPVVTTDDAEVARLAFAHFIERKFRHFAYCGVERYVWSATRGRVFDELVRGAGLKCAHYAGPRQLELHGDSETNAIAQWLRRLPKPVAVFACYDARGQQVLEACQRAGLSAPEQVAVLGVDNDELLCELTPPPLSSIILDAPRAGWEAAALLDRLMRGEKIPPRVHYIPPPGLVVRRSTDTYAVADPQLARILEFLREHACRGLTVGEILRRHPMSRRALEQRVRAVLGRSPHEEITRLKIARAKELLLTSELTLGEIAEHSGFKDAQYLSVAFKRECALPPGRYRSEARRGGSAGPKPRAQKRKRNALPPIAE
jgi:LacI family transcriptional regulator